MSTTEDNALHPRRNLGNRYRSNALKFARLADSDPEKRSEHLNWAEQNARQALLHDYTDSRNWICLLDLKLIVEDEIGLHAVIKDLFSVLGRDPEQTAQLDNIDFLEHGKELLNAALLKDPLNPDEWWTLISNVESEKHRNEVVHQFIDRCKRLDFRDQRAHIIFTRRLQILSLKGYEDAFLEISHHLLAHRPQNHELWLQIGRTHERREEYDQAWLCYDHVQHLRPHLHPREDFIKRIEEIMDGHERQPWIEPSVANRSEFLNKMLMLTSRLQSETATIEPEPDSGVQEANDEAKLKQLIEEHSLEEAFFYARRLVANGEVWAEPYLVDIQQSLG